MSDKQRRVRMTVSDDSGDAFTVSLWGTGATLLDQFNGLPGRYDGQAAGVLADWLEDNADEILTEMTQKVARALATKIHRLRSICGDPNRNRRPS